MDHFDSIGRSVQSEIYRAGALGRRPRVPATPERLEAAARRRMSRAAWSYVAGSAGQRQTDLANQAAFHRWKIVPRVLRDISIRDMRVELFGRTLPAPFLLAPIGALGTVRADADVAAARAARRLDMPMIISTQASSPMEAIADALGDAPRWFQLYSSSRTTAVARLTAPSAH